MDEFNPKSKIQNLKSVGPSYSLASAHQVGNIGQSARGTKIAVWRPVDRMDAISAVSLTNPMTDESSMRSIWAAPAFVINRNIIGVSNKQGCLWDETLKWDETLNVDLDRDVV